MDGTPTVPVRRQIAGFLKRFKKAARLNGGIDFVPRKERLDSLAELGLTVQAANEAVFALSPAFYCEGPLPENHGFPGEVWVFGKHIAGELVYIKLYLSTVAGERRPAKLISFHKARQPMRFPHGSGQPGGDDV